MPIRKRHKKSLFNPHLFRGDPSLTKLMRSKGICDELETGIFGAGLEDDVAFDSAVIAGSLSGPLTLKVLGDTIDLSKMGSGTLIVPQWVESDSLKFVKCSADGIIVVERDAVAARLIQYALMRDLNLVISSSFGFPLVRMRRFLHRFQKETGLPVYLLTDNDTWGYFIFSILKRGMFSPDDTCAYLSIDDVRFLGLRAGESAFFGSENLLIKWKAAWDWRLSYMQKYDCFKSAAWRREFSAFKRQRGKYELQSTMCHNGPERLTEYIAKKLKSRKWLR